MSKYRTLLPQLSGDLFITDGGLETTLVFLQGVNLPEFAAFVLLQEPEGMQRLERYYRDYAALAERYQVGLILDSPTWRANRDWGEKLGLSNEALAELNRRSIELLTNVRDSMESQGASGVIGGCVGPRADGYVPGRRMTVQEAADYHLEQIRTFAETSADMINALTINYVEEAIGVALAAQSAGMPVAVSFTVETDGRLPTGETLREAIEKTDEATGRFPVYYMINCAHPEHFRPSLERTGDWQTRIRGLRANASTKSHAELNESTELDAGNPGQLGSDLQSLRTRHSQLNVLGGCCGTDLRHVEAICQAVLR